MTPNRKETKQNLSWLWRGLIIFVITGLIGAGAGIVLSYKSKAEDGPKALQIARDVSLRTDSLEKSFLIQKYECLKNKEVTDKEFIFVNEKLDILLRFFKLEIPEKNDGKNISRSTSNK